MTNFEKYGDNAPSVWFATQGLGLSITSETTSSIISAFWVWGNSPATPTLTPEERKIAEVLQVLGFTEWLARDKNGRLWGYRKRPSREGEQWEGHGHFGFSENTNSLFSFVQWTDTEPTKISDLLEVK